MVTRLFNWTIATLANTYLANTNTLIARLTKVIRTSLKVTSRISFVKLQRGLIFTKKPFQFYDFYLRNIFQKYVKKC